MRLLKNVFLVTELLQCKEIIICFLKCWSVAVLNYINRYTNNNKFLYSCNKPHLVMLYYFDCASGLFDKIVLKIEEHYIPSRNDD